MTDYYMCPYKYDGLCEEKCTGHGKLHEFVDQCKDTGDINPNGGCPECVFVLRDTDIVIPPEKEFIGKGEMEF